MHKSTKRSLRWGGIIGLVVILLVLIIGCQGSPGEQGPAGPPGDVATVPTFAIKFDPDKPGCGGVCHEEVAPYIQPNPEGKYTLAYEANHAYAGHNFDPLGELKTLNDCLACHAVGTGARAGKGTVAPTALRDIVHPRHVGSPHFTVTLEGDEEPRPGNCFTCHEVSGPSTTGLHE